MNKSIPEIKSDQSALQDQSVVTNALKGYRGRHEVSCNHY